MRPLADQRRDTLAKFGVVSEQVLSKQSPFLATETGTVARLWPTSVLGQLLIVRREDSVMVVTDGISDPWDPELHIDAPEWTYGYEMAIEAPLSALSDPSDEGIATSWLPAALWAATDWVMLERFDVKRRLAAKGALTHAVAPAHGLDRLVSDNGFIGGLLGIPAMGPDYVAGEVVLGHSGVPNEDGVWLLPLKLLTADEYDWARGVEDAARARQLALAFMKDDANRHLSWPDRPSILPQFPASMA